MWYAPVIGYGFSVFAEAILVKSLVETLWDCISPNSSSNPEIRPHPWQGDTLARIEGVLYVAFLQLGLGQLIGVWLALKVAGQFPDMKSLPDVHLTLYGAYKSSQDYAKAADSLQKYIDGGGLAPDDAANRKQEVQNLLSKARANGQIK